MNHRVFRRPASLDPAQAEDLAGVVDPARRVHLVHEVAHALVGGRSRSAWASPSGAERTDGGPGLAALLADEHSLSDDATTLALEAALSDPETLQRVVRTEGLDAVAGLWSDSPAETLPGALWRLYLLQDVVRRDPVTVAQRCRVGVRQVPTLAGAAGLGERPDVAELVRVIDEMVGELMAGRVEVALRRAAGLCRVLATGSAVDADRLDEFVTEDALPGLEPLTSPSRLVRGARALLSTADELDRAAELWAAGKLD